MSTRQDITYYRDRGFTLRLPAVPGMTCEVCNSGEVIHAAQALAMPMYVRCLRCGHRWPKS